MVKKVKKHPPLRYCFHCKRVHALSLHKHHGKGSFKKVRSKASFKAAMKPKTKRRTTRKNIMSFGTSKDPPSTEERYWMKYGKPKPKRKFSQKKSRR